ncbi:MAG: sensor histidine kinase [Omnitrophica WOR_2 bacterium]
MMINSMEYRPSLPIRYALAVLAVMAASLGIFYLVFHPQVKDIGLMALFLSITAVLSILAGYGAYRLGWMDQSPTLRWTLLAGYVLSGLLMFINVWVTARLMFTSQHDLLLATVLLLFATGIAIALGLFFSTTLAERIHLLDRTAQAIAHGNLTVRVSIPGRDEVGALANTFNQMAVQLQAADRKQHELDHLRRDLIAWVSHDLQTPLASIRAVIEALADGIVEDPQTAQRYLRTSQREIGFLSAMIDDLFQMAQLDAGGIPLNKEQCSLSDLISDTLESFSELAARQGITLEGNVIPGIDPVFVDIPRVGRVLNNLVGNALRYTQAGGKVQVMAAPGEQSILVEVSDTGEGIPAQDLPYIFDRFYRSDKSRNRATGGAGLGLAIARGIIEAHGGTISVESEPNVGTRFYFTLPR